MSKHSFSTFMKKILALSTVLSIMLIPSVSLAKEPEKAKDVLADIPLATLVKGYVVKAWDILSPDFGLWWIYFTIALTIAWLILATKQTKKFFNTCGGLIVFGPLILGLASFYIAPIGFAISIFVGIFWLISLGTNPSWSGFGTLIIAAFMLIPLAFILYVLQKVKAKEFVMEFLQWVGKGIKWCVTKQKEVMATPNLGWQMLGAIVFALLVNSAFLTDLTTDVAFPGLIPGISSVLGIFFISYRLYLHYKVLPPGWWRCDLVADMPMYDKQHYKKTGEIRLHTNPDGSPKWKRNVKCGATNKPGNLTCCRDYCNNTPGWPCPKCGDMGEDTIVETPVEGMEPKKEVFKSKGISWKILKCTQCGTRQPARTTEFHTPDKDIFTAPEVLPSMYTPPTPLVTTPPTDTPTTTPPVAPPPTAPAKVAARWSECPKCKLAVVLYKTPQHCRKCGECLLEASQPLVANKQKAGIPTLADLMWRTP